METDALPHSLIPRDSVVMEETALRFFRGLGVVRIGILFQTSFEYAANAAKEKLSEKGIVCAIVICRDTRSNFSGIFSDAGVKYILYFTESSKFDDWIWSGSSNETVFISGFAVFPGESKSRRLVSFTETLSEEGHLFANSSTLPLVGYYAFGESVTFFNHRNKNRMMP